MGRQYVTIANAKWPTICANASYLFFVIAIGQAIRKNEIGNLIYTMTETEASISICRRIIRVGANHLFFVTVCRWRVLHIAIPTQMSKRAKSPSTSRDTPEIFATDLLARIPRKEVAAHFAFIAKFAPSATIAGSYRRGAESSSDIDVIIRESMESVVGKLVAVGYIYHAFAMGSKKFSGVVRLPGPNRTYRHLDLVFTTPRSYPFALLFFTGSARTNIIMRVKAKRLGLRLNEYGLWRITKAGPVLIEGITTERQIYSALGMPFKEPRDR